MSATHPITADTESVRPDRAFERRIWTNHQICNECFTRVKRAYTRAGKWADRDIDVTTRTDQAHLGQDDSDPGLTANHNTGVYRPRTFCETCGGRGAVHTDIASLDQLLDRLPTLSRRIDEEGISHSVDALYAFVRRLKSMDAVQGRDRELLEAAVWFAIERDRGKLQSQMAFARRLRSGNRLPDLLDPDA